VSISLPGLARFGCDLSATVGWIPNFDQTSQSRGIRSLRHRREASAERQARSCRSSDQSNGLAFSLGGIHQSIRQLRPYPRPRSLLATMADRALAGAWNPAEPRFSPSREGAIREWACGTAILNASLCGDLATAGRRLSGEQTDRHSYIRLSDNLLLGRFGPPTLP
jgi:hypothetical protein